MVDCGQRLENVNGPGRKVRGRGGAHSETPKKERGKKLRQLPKKKTPIRGAGGERTSPVSKQGTTSGQSGEEVVFTVSDDQKGGYEEIELMGNGAERGGRQCENGGSKERIKGRHGEHIQKGSQAYI